MPLHSLDKGRRGLLAWSLLPLLAGLMSSYGPVGNNYGFALYFLNYSHGFVKRGLVGSLLMGVGFLSRGTLLAIEFGFLLAAFALTYGVLRRVIFGESWERVLAAVLLCGPALLPHLGYLFAQPDVTLYLVMLCSLAVWLRVRPATAVWMVSGLSVVGMLGHEAYLLMFYPLMVAVIWEKCRKRELRWAVAAANVLLVAAAWMAIVHWGGLKVPPEQILEEASARTDVAIQRQVYDVMASSLAQQRELVVRMYSPPVIRVLLLTLVLAAPYFYLLVMLLRRATQARGMSAFDRVVLGVAFCSPLVLCWLGHDTTRWMGAGCADASLFVLYLALRDEAVRASLREWVEGGTAHLWLAYGLMMGPFGATGIRTAEQMSVLWAGR